MLFGHWQVRRPDRREEVGVGPQQRAHPHETQTQQDDGRQRRKRARRTPVDFRNLHKDDGDRIECAGSEDWAAQAPPRLDKIAAPARPHDDQHMDHNGSAGDIVAEQEDVARRAIAGEPRRRRDRQKEQSRRETSKFKASPVAKELRCKSPEEPGAHRGEGANHKPRRPERFHDRRVLRQRVTCRAEAEEDARDARRRERAAQHHDGDPYKCANSAAARQQFEDPNVHSRHVFLCDKVSPAL